MSLDIEKKVSLKKFLKLSEAYDHYDRYIRLYCFADTDGTRRLIALTHHEVKVKNPVDKNNDLKMTISYFCEVPTRYLNVSDSNGGGERLPTNYGKRPIKVFHLHYTDAWNFLAALRLFDVTKADSLGIEYYPNNNSTNNEQKGLYQESLRIVILRPAKHNDSGDRGKYQISIDNQYIHEVTRLIDNPSWGGHTIEDARKLLAATITED